MAEKKAKGSFAKKKIAGIPAPLVVGVGVVAVYYLYKRFKGSSSSSTAAPTTDTTGLPGYSDGSGSGGGAGGGSAAGQPTSPTTTATGTQTGTGSDYTGTGTTAAATSSAPIFDTAQPGNPYGQGVAYVQPGVGDLPPGVLPVAYTPPATTTLSAASGALASNPAQGGHSL